MKRPRLIVGILAIIHLILAVIAFCYFEYWKSPGPITYPFLGIVWFALFPCQASLIVLWAALGKRTPLRVMLTVIGIVICLWVVRYPAFSHDSWEAMQISSVQIMTLGVTLLVFRFTGLEMKLAPLEPWTPKPFQFSIWQIMTWTATLAVIMSALHYFPENANWLFPGIGALLVIAGGLGNVGLMSMWLVIGNKWIALRVLMMLAAIGSGTWLFVSTFDTLGWMHFGALLGCQAAWTIASLLVIRWAGYQLTWHWRLRRYNEPVATDAT
jgi:hypothetical protein